MPNKSFEKCLGMALTNENYMQEEIKSRLVFSIVSCLLSLECED
jgi:hypothetical protein